MQLPWDLSRFHLKPDGEADHSRLVSGDFYKQGNLHERLVLGGCKASRFLYPARILKSYLEVLPGLSHVYHPDGFNNSLLCQGDSSWNTVIMWAGCSFQGWGDGEEPLIAQVQLTGQPEVTTSL